MRLDSSLNVPKEDIEVLPDQTPTFTIKSDNQKSTYKACFGDDNSMPFCTCPDWTEHHLPCKHMCAIFRNFAPEYSWDSLSSLYRLSPFFQLDNEESVMGNNISASQTTNHNIEETDYEVEENESLETTVNKITETKKNTALNVKKKAFQCRELLAQLRDLTYLCEKEDALEDLKASLTASLLSFRPQVPSESGLLLEKNCQRKVKTNKRVLTAVKYADLPPRKKLRKDKTRNKENRKRKPHLPKLSQSMSSKKKEKRAASVPRRTATPLLSQKTAQTETIDPASLTPPLLLPQMAQAKRTESAPVCKPTISVSPSLPGQPEVLEGKDTAPAAPMPKQPSSPTSQMHATLSNDNPLYSDLSSFPSLLQQSTEGQPSPAEKKFVPVKVVQGSTSQQNEKFSDSNRGKQCTSNSLTFLLHYLTSPGEKQSKATIDAVLSVGDKLHTALTKALKCPGERLSFEDVSKAVKLLGEGDSILFPQGILSGDIFSLSSNPPFLPLKVALQNALLNNSGTLLRFLEFTVAVCKLPDGYYNLFDPHARNQKGFVDGNGTAVIMSFPTVDSLVNHVRTFVGQNGLETAIQKPVDSLSMADRSFELLPVVISNKHYGQPQKNSCLSRMTSGVSSEQKDISFQR